jgi:hypothetical protein
MLAWFTDARDARAHDAPLADTAYGKLSTLLRTLPPRTGMDLLVTGPADMSSAIHKPAANTLARWLSGFRDVDRLSHRLLA